MIIAMIGIFILIIIIVVMDFKKAFDKVLTLCCSKNCKRYRV